MTRTHTRHTLIVLTVLALLVASAAIALSAEARLRPVTGMTLTDANGRTVGGIIGITAGSRPLVTMRTGSLAIAMEAFTNELTQTDGGNVKATEVFFQSADCSGQSFLREYFAFDPLALLQPVGLTAQRLYQASGPLQSITARSFRSSDFVCVTAAEAGYPDGIELRAVPAALVADLGAEFTPPYHLRFVGGD